jgi:hypothetical protein
MKNDYLFMFIGLGLLCWGAWEAWGIGYGLMGLGMVCVLLALVSSRSSDTPRNGYTNRVLRWLRQRAVQRPDDATG